MSQATQATRKIAIETPLGEDVLLLRGFSASELISRLFAFELDLLSENHEINFDEIIGQNVTIRMDLPGGGTRYWNGFISRFVQGASTSRRFAQYRATMVPWLWFLTLKSDCRIFQEMSVPEIVRQVFEDLGFSDIEDRTSGGYRQWTYCVQYRETAFNFVSRLMEQEGIYYYFAHEQGKCTIVLCDSRSKHDAFADYEEIAFIPDTRASSTQERINEWTVVKNASSGKFAHTDYNFLKPSASLMSVEEDQKDHAHAGYEIFDFPGEYAENADGDKYAKVRMEELAQSHEVCDGDSDSRGLCAGHLFTMTGHTRRDQNRKYLITSTSCHASAEDYETSGGQQALWSCSFTAIPASVQFRPMRTTPKPLVEGTQTAIVTGPSGEEIYTDGHGRVKVQFYWDRRGLNDENSSCWIRVSQPWAGSGWGGMFIPHIGHEVIVGFEEGDPDRPMITGRVYNGNNMPADALPDEKTKSVIRSWKDNDIVIEDKDGDKHIHIKQANGNEIILHEGTPSIDIKQACGNFIHMRDGEGIHIQDYYGNEVKLDAAAGTLKVRSPSHESVMELGKSIWLGTMSDVRQKANGNWFTAIHGSKDEHVVGPTTFKYDGVNAKIHGGLVSDTFIGGKHETLVGVKVSYNIAKEINKNALDRDRISQGHIYYGSAKYISLDAPSGMIFLDGKGALIAAGGTKVQIENNGNISLNTSKKVVIKASSAIILEAADCKIQSKTKIYKPFESPNIKDRG